MDGYRLAQDSLSHSHRNRYHQQHQQCQRTVSWDPGKTGIQEWVDRFDIKSQELLLVENLRLAGLESLCIPAPEIREHSILLSMNRPMLLKTTFKANRLVCNGKAEQPRKEYITYQEMQQWLFQEETLLLGQHKIILGGGLHLGLPWFQSLPGIRLAIPLQ